MNLWVDDLRDPLIYGKVTHDRLDWVWAKSVGDAVQYILKGDVERISLDHDFEHQKYNGEDLIHWMSKHNRWPTKGIALHSSNVHGLTNMSKLLVKLSPFSPTGLYQWGDFSASAEANPLKTQEIKNKKK